MLKKNFFFDFLYALYKALIINQKKKLEMNQTKIEINK